MFFPPSLPAEVLSRSFSAENGEVGICLADAVPFLDACACDGIGMLGWELWVVDHVSDPASKELQPAEGRWTGVIPVTEAPLSAVIGGEGDLGTVRHQLLGLEKDLARIVPKWLPFIRMNFTLD